MSSSSAADPSPYNFSAASSLDDTVVVACRPGAWPCAPHAPGATRIGEVEVAAWASFAASKGVTRVLSLLSPDEVESYAAPVAAALAAKGITELANVVPKLPGAHAEAMAFLSAAHAAGARVLVHCWGSNGRAGRVAAAWLVHRHGLSTAAASAEVAATAAAARASRTADAPALEAFIAASAPVAPIAAAEQPDWKPFRLAGAAAEADWVQTLELDAARAFAPHAGAGAGAGASAAAPAHAPRFLVLYGSLRTTSYSRLLAFEFARVLESLGGDCRVFDPRGLPAHDAERSERHPKVRELRALSEWSEGHVWVSPEQHGAITGLFKTQLDWLPLLVGSVRPTQGRTLAVAEVSGGSQSFNAVNTLRLLGRWMRMICVPNQSSVPMAWTQFDAGGRMKAGDLRARVVDVAEELFRFTLLTRPHAAALVDRFSEREEVRAKGRLQTQAEKVAADKAAADKAAPEKAAPAVGGAAAAAAAASAT